MRLGPNAAEHGRSGVVSEQGRATLFVAENHLKDFEEADSAGGAGRQVLHRPRQGMRRRGEGPVPGPAAGPPPGIHRVHVYSLHLANRSG